ncbi:TetR/AcrR family transcriptional regulator [Planotetraspora kaengkrachanensis]|uniref:TetR family transcriptional regulator n=1 Tax=Planotetraspora kaengkrachanensis TaxID=575193 RepID=A0A8J3LXA2_9ACTN|nr:TetR/AcrR family transcriptional regulator [Planotetraspora kaengkrachanensis]GIG78395.1 TetR family transcriptional regulator [Planotetraspora kaengkrachanensis]
MRQNQARRMALLDAAIDVLAREGARGLTFRAVDAQAGVPGGTTSNYFANRDDLLTQAGTRIYEHMQPDVATMAKSLEGPRDRERVTGLMHDLVERIGAYSVGYLALLELRLEATRRPALRAVLTEQVKANVDANVEYHLGTGLPGDATTVELLYLAMNWLIVERLTLPGVFTEARLRELVDGAVERIVPAG